MLASPIVQPGTAAGWEANNEPLRAARHGLDASGASGSRVGAISDNVRQTVRTLTGTVRLCYVFGCIGGHRDLLKTSCSETSGYEDFLSSAQQPRLATTQRSH